MDFNDLDVNEHFGLEVNYIPYEKMNYTTIVDVWRELLDHRAHVKDMVKIDFITERESKPILKRIDKRIDKVQVIKTAKWEAKQKAEVDEPEFNPCDHAIMGGMIDDNKFR